MKLLCSWIVAMTAFSAIALAQDTRYNFDSKADFSKYKTYKWVDIKGERPDDLTDRQIRDVIDGELVKKGLSKTDSDSADLFVGYQAAINTEKEMTSFDSGMGGWGYGPGWGYGGTGISTTTTSTLYVGALTFDMYDTSQKKLVWRGVASKTLDTKAKPEKRQKNLQKAAAKLFKNYPPKVKS